MNDWLFDNAAELLARSIPPQKWVIEGLLPEGLTLLCGAPKAGKSWLTLDIALHVASGQPFWGHKTTAGRVLLFALEDGQRRMKARLEALLDGRDDLYPALLYPCFAVPPLESGFAAGLDAQLAGFGGEEKVSLVIVDTLGKIRTASKLDGFQRDYEQLAELKKVADKHHVALIVVHHLRKLWSADPFEQISGTNAILGASDAAFVLKRDGRTERNATLYFTSRDADDKELALRFDESCRWNLLSSDAEEYEFINNPLVRFLTQLDTPWQGFSSDLMGEFMAFCAKEGLDTGLTTSSTPAAFGRKLAGIVHGLWRVRLSLTQRHTSKGNLFELTKM